MIETILANLEDGNAAYGGKSLSERVTGRFYTPDVIGLDLAKSLIDAWPKSIRATENKISVCDPFCGDGRLVCQSASKFDPRSASNFDPFWRRVLAVALAPSELVGVAETARARLV